MFMIRTLGRGYCGGMDMHYIEHILGDIHYPIKKGQLIKEIEKKAQMK
jgi:hypothetical protein